MLLAKKQQTSNCCYFRKILPYCWINVKLYCKFFCPQLNIHIVHNYFKMVYCLSINLLLTKLIKSNHIHLYGPAMHVEDKRRVKLIGKNCTEKFQITPTNIVLIEGEVN